MGLQVITTVMEAAESYALTTLDDVKEELQITDTASDIWLGNVITRISDQIHKYCNRVFPVETVQDFIYFQQDPYPYQVPGGSITLQLARWPIVSITSVMVNDPAGSPQTLVANTNFTVNQKAGQLIRINEFTGFPVTWQAAPTVVVYQAGYATTPPDLEDACIRLIKTKYFARDRDPALKSTDDSGIGTQSFWVGSLGPGMMPPDIADLLDSYRVRVVA